MVSQDYRERGEIVVLTRNHPISYYEDKTGEIVGYEHDLVEKFAQSANIKVIYRVKNSMAEVLSDLRIGAANFAAVGVPITKEIAEEFALGPAHLPIEKRILCQKSLKLTKLEDIASHTVIVIGDGEELEPKEHFAAMYPNIKWESGKGIDLSQWLDELVNKKSDCVLVSSTWMELEKRPLIGIQQVAVLPQKSELRWILARGQKRLTQDLYSWLQKIEKEQVLKTVQDQYLSPNSEYNQYDTELFMKKVKSELPRLKAWFQVAAKKISMDWRLLAAVGYQESHWSPEARSPTGVRGIMMLTMPTAKELGIADRTDPQQSIIGGATYLQQTLDRFPGFISPEDKLWLSLAAYNVGWAHLKDARKLAIDLNKNPNEWNAVKDVFPLLTQSQYYLKLEHGYARGYEPVIYVSRIQRYYELLKSEFPP